MILTWFPKSFLALCTVALLPHSAYSQAERLWYKINPNAPLTGFTKENQLLATDSKGNCFMVAQTYRARRDSDIQVMKYSSTGELLWERWIEGTAHRVDRALAIAVDRKDSLIVAGYMDNLETGRDALLTKFSPTGEIVFTNQTTDARERNDEWSKLLLSPEGNIYVLGTHGTTSEAASEASFVVRAYSQPGATLWTHREDGLRRVTGYGVMALRPAYTSTETPSTPTESKAPPSNDKASIDPKTLTSQKLDPKVLKPVPVPRSKPVSVKTIRHPASLVVVRLQGEGTPGLRVQHFNPIRGTLLGREDHRGIRFINPGYSTPDLVADLTGLASLSDLKATSSGELKLMGGTYGRGNNGGAFVLHFDTANNPAWGTRFEPTNGNYSSLTSFEMDVEGNVYLAGMNNLTGSAVAGIAGKISNTGRIEWQQRDERVAWIRGIVLDNSGRLIVTGRNEGRGIPSSRATVMLFSRDGTGTLLDTMDPSDYRFEGTTSFNGYRTESQGLALSRDGSLYMGGEFGGASFAGNLLVKYRLP
jgi:hypothetical protein